MESMMDMDPEVLPDSWLVIPFLLGFVVFRSPIGNAFEEVVLELVSKTGCPVVSGLSKAALERKRMSGGHQKKYEYNTADDETCRSELWHLRQEILQERNAMRA